MWLIAGIKNALRRKHGVCSMSFSPSVNNVIALLSYPDEGAFFAVTVRGNIEVTPRSWNAMLCQAYQDNAVVTSIARDQYPRSERISLQLPNNYARLMEIPDLPRLTPEEWAWLEQHPQLAAAQRRLRQSWATVLQQMEGPRQVLGVRNGR